MNLGLEELGLEALSDDFVFDNQLLARILLKNRPIGEVSCPTRYFEEDSSINFSRSGRYGFGCLGTALAFRLSRLGLAPSALFRHK